jgi:hypothetical protein
MKSRFLLLWLVLLAAFNFLFWSEAPGLNMLLFAILVMIALFIRYPVAWRRKTVQLSGICTLACGIMVTLYGPGWSVFALIISLSVFAVFVMEPLFRSVSGALLQFGLNLFLWTMALERNREDQPAGKRSSGRAWFLTKVLLIPLIVTFLFFILYMWGNPHFAEIFSGFFESLREFFENFSFPHFFFLVGGGILCGALLVLYKFGLERYEQTPDAVMRRKRKSYFPVGMIALRRELKIGIVMLALLNVLLLFVNGLDIARVWNHFVVPENFSLKNFVHEGTWVLMFSNFLSMVVLLWLFKGNIHFYKKNTWLKRLAYIWIGQNIFLALSLFKRNYHYIDFHGLAGGRIVVIAFLALVIAGLISFIIKIKKDRSVFFLHRVNSWAAYFLIVLVSFVNWDKVIVNFNLQHSNPGQIDIDYYLSVRGNAFPLVYKNAALIKTQMEAHKRNPVTWVYHLDFTGFRHTLDEKAKSYLKMRAERSWVSWNLADAEAVAQLKSIQSLHEKPH